jgi:hypothetical protein
MMGSEGWIRHRWPGNENGINVRGRQPDGKLMPYSLPGPGTPMHLSLNSLHPATVELNTPGRFDPGIGGKGPWSSFQSHSPSPGPSCC